ncbi:tRNA pseudouridine synthase D [Periconia macrospinosa]|uniref:tRNA pseudouridine synthase D n=1 Tax=Periconia macrospinosa TaxID=97972 RepID=A0A2V1DHK6_9PLEO|nr:tRNA pseudouridine synthase D [Periconia macrospinosa]
MHDDADARPAKRARLDSPSSTPAADPATTSTSTPAPVKSGPLGSDKPSSVDEDLEREIRAGITEYVCAENAGFRGVLKQRYTDFLVNEIGLDGEVVRLTVVGVEEEKDKAPKKEEGRGEKEKTNKEGKKNEGKVAEHQEKVTLVVEDGNEAAPVKQPKKIEIRIEDDVEENGTEKAEVKEENGEEAAGDTQLSEEDLATLHSIFGEQTTKEILSLVQAIRKHDHKKAKDFKAVIVPPITDKDIRTQAHRSLRNMFPNLLESGMEADQSIRIKAAPPKDRKGKKNNRDRGARDGRDPDPGRRRGQLAWDELGGEFLHFTLYKENKDTMEVVGFLGSKLGGGSKPFGFAGTKDRRACTVQRVCIKRQTAERMSHFNKLLYNAAIGNFTYRNHDIRLGDLKGNEFHITLRDCHFNGEEGLDSAQRLKLANDVVSKAITDFSEKGFINYYGLQRFGSFAASTDTIGLKMLQGDLKGAVEDLLAYTDSALEAANSTDENKSTVLVSQDDKNRAKALHLWRTTGSGKAVLDMLPRKFTAERNIIQHLSSRNSKSGARDRKSDWQGALMCIPRNLRLMYVHAYQSLVWNTVAGQRWATYGARVVEGDLVLVHEHADKLPSATTTDNTTIDQDGETIINPTGTDSALAHEAQFDRARALTAAEAASGLYTVYDVVLPQPGFDVEYPANEIGTFYSTFMKSERGGGLDPHHMRRSWREVSLSGGYRKFLAKPLRPLEYQVKEYTKPDEQFVETDLERVKKAGTVLGPEPREKEGGDTPMKDAADTAAEEVKDEESSKKIATVIKLQLGSSQYATIALRELMKAGGVQAYKPEFMGGR